MVIFWLILLGFFIFALLHPMNYTPRFCLMKNVIKIYVSGTFHQYSICGCEIKMFQRFLCIDSASMKLAPFWVIWPIFALIMLSLAEILTRSSPIRQTHCLKISLKFWKLAKKERTESLWFWSILGHNLLPCHSMTGDASLDMTYLRIWEKFDELLQYIRHDISWKFQVNILYGLGEIMKISG